MIWDCVQLVFLLMGITWLAILVVVLDTDFSKIKKVVIGSSIIIPDVYLIGLFFWKLFQMVS